MSGEQNDEEDGQRPLPEPPGYVEADATGFDNPVVNKMDGHYMVTMNNEKIGQSCIPFKDVRKYVARVHLMGADEMMYAGGFYSVATARAIDAGAFTLEMSLYGGSDRAIAIKNTERAVQWIWNDRKKGGGWLGRFRKGRNESSSYMEEQR